MSETPSPYKPVEYTIILSPGYEQKVRETLKRITLFRVGAHLTGVAQKAHLPTLAAEFSAVREDLVGMKEYLPLYQEMKRLYSVTHNMYCGELFENDSKARQNTDHALKSETAVVDFNALQNISWKRNIAPVFGIAQSRNDTLTIDSIGDVLNSLHPHNTTKELSLSMGKRYIYYNTLDANTIEEPIPAPTLGYLNTYTKHPAELELIRQRAQELWSTPELTSLRMITVLPPPRAIRRTSSHQEPTPPIQITPLIYFKMQYNIDPTGKNSNYIDPAFKHFLDSVQSQLTPVR